jgi:predicted acetyltransferase
MTLEIRAARPEEMRRFMEVDGIAFAREGDPDDHHWLRPEWTMCAFEDGEMTTTHAAFPFSMRFNGAKVPVAGVTAVSSLPWHRRKGHLRRIMDHEFGRWREEGSAPIAILYASMAAIYQRFGYAIVSRRGLYQLDRREIKWSFASEVGGRVRGADSADLALLDDLYRRFTAARTGPLHRSPEMWQKGVLREHPGRGVVRMVVYEEAGTPLGYLVYSVADDAPTGPGPNQTVHLREIVWHSAAAYRGLWEYLGRIDLAKEVRAMPVPPDDPIFELLLEPRLLTPRFFDGLMARIIDVERALPARRYADEAVLTFRARDEMCAWNDGRWRLEVGPEGARVRATDGEPQLTLPVDTLAKLAFGYLTASQAARMGRLDVHDAAALPLWDRALRTEYPPYCMDHF